MFKMTHQSENALGCDKFPGKKVTQDYCWDTLHGANGSCKKI